MKIIALTCACLSLTFVGTALADTNSSSDNSIAKSNVSAEKVAEIRIEAIARALADLKLQEITLQQSSPVDADKLKLVSAQYRGLEQEILKIRINTLEERRQILSDKYLPEYPLMKQLQVEINVCKEELKRST